MIARHNYAHNTIYLHFNYVYDFDHQYDVCSMYHYMYLYICTSYNYNYVYVIIITPKLQQHCNYFYKQDFEHLAVRGWMEEHWRPVRF